MVTGQNLDQQLEGLQKELEILEARKVSVLEQIEEVKLGMIQRDLVAIGLPSDRYIMHSAMALEYAEEHEQARWVAHIILPDVATGTVTRTNDFRPDPKVSTGTAQETDYFLKTPLQDGKFQYDGFGYDRGHLAPSADFKWSERALSESYFYSNMAPQSPDLNRGPWAEMESVLREYVTGHDTPLYVVTGGVLEADLPVVSRAKNHLTVPRTFFKVALDAETGVAIGFLMPNGPLEYPLEHYAVSVDEVEAATGLDFFQALPEADEKRVESALDKEKWLSALASRDVEPIYPPSLKPGHFNTVQAKQYLGKGEKISVCGTVVSARYSRSSNLWLNIDKQFPNQIFSVFIRKDDLVNFSYRPDVKLINQQVCFTGKVENFDGTPTINLQKESEVSLDIPLK
jgi:endonuclease G, mitochondrial